MDLRPASAPYCRDSYLSYGLMQVSISFIMLVFIFFFFLISDERGGGEEVFMQCRHCENTRGDRWYVFN